jgi:hypothetical protein
MKLAAAVGSSDNPAVQHQGKAQTRRCEFYWYWPGPAERNEMLAKPSFRP